MKKNMGITDRIIRSMIAVTMISLYYTQVITGTLGIVLIVLSVIFLLTSLVSFCPLYAMLGISSKQKEN